MTKKPFAVEENTLLIDILSKMNKKRITSVCIFNKKNRKKLLEWFTFIKSLSF